MNQKIEDDGYAGTPIYLKYEGLKLEDPCYLVKNEESPINPNHQLQHNLSISLQVNRRFDELFLSLEHYLDNFVEVEDFIIISNVHTTKEVDDIISEAKREFKEWGLKVVKSLSADLKKKAVQHLLPDTHLVQVIESTKRRIFNSYKQLKKNISEALADRDKQIKVKEETIIPKKRIIKKKSDFPDHARLLLKSWFMAHLHDPYPCHEEKIHLAKEGGISMKQIENWLTNTRGRIWKKKHPAPEFGSEIQKIFFDCKKEELL